MKVVSFVNTSYDEQVLENIPKLRQILIELKKSKNISDPTTLLKETLQKLVGIMNFTAYKRFKGNAVYNISQSMQKENQQE